jgi:signal peptidase I
MTSPQPPPLPETKRTAVKRVRIFIVLAFIIGTSLYVLWVGGLIRPFSVPTGAMAPTISPGDKVMMEGVSYLVRKPHRGDVVVFKSTGIPMLSSGTPYIKRIAGEPGDRVRIAGGKLYINDMHVSLRNEKGEIAYIPPPGAPATSLHTDLTVPEGHYFMLGDNSANSLDSRFWSTVPAANIMGRVAFRYWPINRVGGVR